MKIRIDAIKNAKVISNFEGNLINNGRLNNMTTKQAHTPGPWNIENQSEIINKHNELIAKAWTADYISWEQTKANARLIAASPELLEACKESLDFIIGHIPDYGNEYLLVEKLEKIIAKYTGKAEEN